MKIFVSEKKENGFKMICGEPLLTNLVRRAYYNEPVVKNEIFDILY